MAMIGRPSLTRERIADTALEITDQSGLAGLSMRKLGAELGVEAMSLYHYVTNKDDLLDAILDRLYLEIDLPYDVDPTDWETAIRRGLTAFHDVLVRHRAALELFASRPATSPDALAVLLWASGRFEAVGLRPPESHHALHYAVSFVMGHAAMELGAMVELRAGFDPDSLPDGVASDFVRQAQAISSDDQFEAGLDLVVAGLRQRYGLT